MHELSLMEGVRELILERAEAEQFSRVETLWLEVGELSCAEPEALRFCFAAVMAGSIAAEAQLELVSVPGQGRCPGCGQISRIGQLFDPCPVCGSFGLEVLQGRDVRLRSLAVS